MTCEASYARLCISQVLTLKSPLAWNIKDIKDRKIRQYLVLSWQRVSSEEQMCWPYWGGTLVRAKMSRALWWPTSTVWLPNAKASKDTGNHTQFSKAKGQQHAVWLLGEVNVHVHITYRHHDHLNFWASGFQKVLDKEVSSVSTSVSFILVLFWDSSIEVELCGGGSTPPNYCSAVLCSSTVCVYEMRVQSCVAVCLRDEGYWEMRTEDGSRSRLKWGRRDGRRATESVGGVWVDAARWTRRGGDRRGVVCVLPAVSLQTGTRVFCMRV